MQYQDKIRKYFSDAAIRVLEKAGCERLQDVIDKTAVGIMQIDGIGKKRFWEIADVMINVCGQNSSEWKWNPDAKKANSDMKGENAMGKKEDMAVYRIVDTATMQIIFVGYTKELTKNTLSTKIDVLKKEAAGRNISLDSHYVLDYIPVSNKKKLIKEREKFYRAYKPLFGAEISVSGEIGDVTEEDHTRWKPWFSGKHDGVLANRNILKALESKSVLKEMDWWGMMKNIFDSPETDRALRSIGEAGVDMTVETAFAKIGKTDKAEENLLSMRTAFIQLVNEKLEKNEPFAVMNETKPVAEETEQKEAEPKKANHWNVTSVKSLEKILETVPESDNEEIPEESFVPDFLPDEEEELKDVSEILEKLKRQREEAENGKSELKTLAERLEESKKSEGFVLGNPPETKTEKETSEFQSDAHWNEIISTVRQRVPEYVSRTLADSNAVISGDTLLITAQNPLFMTIFRKTENAVILADAVTAVLGKRYKLRAKCVNAPETEFQTETVSDFTEQGNDTETVFDKKQFDAWTENQPAPFVHDDEWNNMSMEERIRQTRHENEIKKIIRHKQWEMFFENCAGYYEKDSCNFFVPDTTAKMPYHMPFFMENCQVNGKNENLFFAVADDMNDYALLFRISALYGVKIMILHDIDDNSVIYANGNEAEFTDCFEAYLDVPYMPQSEYQMQVKEDGKLFFTQSAAKTKFTEVCFRFLHFSRELLENKIKNLYSGGQE